MASSTQVCLCRCLLVPYAQVESGELHFFFNAKYTARGGEAEVVSLDSVIYAILVTMAQ